MSNLRQPVLTALAALFCSGGLLAAGDLYNKTPAKVKEVRIHDDTGTSIVAPRLLPDGSKRATLIACPAVPSIHAIAEPPLSCVVTNDVVYVVSSVRACAFAELSTNCVKRLWFSIYVS